MSECPMIIDDAKAGRRLDDVMFLVCDGETRADHSRGFDFPYRQLLPRDFEGLLFTSSVLPQTFHRPYSSPCHPMNRGP